MDDLTQPYNLKGELWAAATGFPVGPPEVVGQSTVSVWMHGPPAMENIIYVCTVKPLSTGTQCVARTFHAMDHCSSVQKFAI